jgi:hypothetical protein
MTMLSDIWHCHQNRRRRQWRRRRRHKVCTTQTKKNCDSVPHNVIVVTVKRIVNERKCLVRVTRSLMTWNRSSMHCFPMRGPVKHIPDSLLLSSISPSVKSERQSFMSLISVGSLPLSSVIYLFSRHLDIVPNHSSVHEKAKRCPYLSISSSVSTAHQTVYRTLYPNVMRESAIIDKSVCMLGMHFAAIVGNYRQSALHFWSLLWSHWRSLRLPLPQRDHEQWSSFTRTKQHRRRIRLHDSQMNGLAVAFRRRMCTIRSDAKRINNESEWLNSWDVVTSECWARMWKLLPVMC